MHAKASPLCPVDPRYDLPSFLAWHCDKFGTATMTAPAPPAPQPEATPVPAPTPPENLAKFTDPDTGESYDFPSSTPLAQMAPTQVAEYWRHKARKHEDTAKSRGDYDVLKTKAAEADELRKERETENEKAVREAGETAAAKERTANAPRLVSAEFRAAAKGVLTPEQTTALLEDLDLSKFLDAKGEVDVVKVEKRVEALAPPAGTLRRLPPLGQGPRGESPKPSVASGREMYEQRRGSTKPKPAA